MAAFFLSGCTATSPITSSKNPMGNATFMRTDDGGKTWTPKMKIDDKKTIAGVDVLSMAVNPIDSNIVYIGTDSNGLFVTKDAGEAWSSVAFPSKAYNLIFDQHNPDIMYASGVLNGRAKIFKRLNETQEWQDIYTEPENGTTISSLAIDSANSNVLYAGTSKGVILKTTDGGQTWINLKKDANINAPIINIGFDAASDSHVFFAVFQIGVLETKNAGATLENISDKIDPATRIKSVYSLTTDPYLSGVVYVGTNAGIFRRASNDTWSPLNIIASSKAFPIRVIAVNPKNSKEIMYSAARAIYKSIDNGATWATFQLDTAKNVGALKYNLNDPSKIYTGYRSF